MQQDLFATFGIEVPSTQPHETPNLTKNNRKKAQGTVQKPVQQKESAKAVKKSAAAVSRYNTQAEIRNRPIPLKGWTVHYALHTFVVEELGRRLVEMEDTSIPEEQVKEALWALIPEETKKVIQEARVCPREKESAEDTSPLESDSPDKADQRQRLEEEKSEEEDDVEVDDEEGIVGERKSDPGKSEVNPNEPKPQKETYDGDLTIAMIGQALSYDYFEFATDGAIEWRIDLPNKRLIPYVGNGKFSAPSKRFFWSWNDREKLNEIPPISIVAGQDGRLYDVRQNPFMQITAATQSVREIPEVKEGVRFILPKIPGEFLAQTFAFFCQLGMEQLEGAVYIVWDRKTETYELHCPLQKVGPFHVHAEYPEYDPSEKLIVVYIHSHHTMPAEFSSDDDRNDQAFSVYGVIGKIFNTPVQINFRAGFNGMYYDVNVWDLFHLEGVHSNPSFPQEWLAHVQRS